MRTTREWLVARFLLVSIFVLVSATLVAAQDIIGGTGREELNRGGTAPPKPKAVYGTRTQKVASTRNAHPTVTTGTLSVAAPPNAAIVLEPIKGGVAREGNVPPNEGLFIYSNLPPGTYRVAAALDGYKPVEQKIQIAANKAKGVTLELEPILYTITITTNVSAGEVRYAPVEAYTEAGEKKFRPIGVTRVVPIVGRVATLRGLIQGKYGLDIRGDFGSGYEARLVSITLPDASEKEEINLDVALKYIRSTETFSGLLSYQWDLPPGWSVASYLLSANGKGISIAHEERYRHYTDFQMVTDAKMLNGIAVSFVLRASENLSDYYLVRLTGAKAEEPFLLSGYAVRNGVKERLQSVPIPHLSRTLKENQFFKVSIIVKDNNIEVSIADSQTGEFFPLGVLIDPNRRFPIGAVGIYAEGKEQSQYGSFIVCSPVCPKQ